MGKRYMVTLRGKTGHRSLSMARLSICKLSLNANQKTWRVTDYFLKNVSDAKMSNS